MSRSQDGIESANNGEADRPSVGRASGQIAIATVVSRLTALLARLLLAAALGFALVNDAYNVANTLPNQVYELLLGGVLSAAAIPVLIRAQRTDSDEGEVYAQRLLTIGFVALVVGTALAVAAAPLLISLMTSDGPGTSQPLATAFAYLLLPQILFYGLAALFGAILNSRERFAAPAWAPVANNIVLIAVITTFLTMDGEVSLRPDLMGEPKLLVLGIGTTLGIVVQAAVLIPALRRSGFRWRWRWGWDPRLTAFASLAGWSVLYSLLGQVGLIVTYRIAGLGDPGGVSTYTYSWILLQVPYGVLGVSLLTALMPRISRSAADGRAGAVADDLAVGTRFSGLMLIPVSAMLTVLGGPLAILLFSYGSSNVEQADRLGQTLAASAFTLVPYAITLLQLRVFYALQDARAPVVIMLAMLAIKTVASIGAVAVLSPTDLVTGLAVANGLSFVAGALIGQIWLRMRVGHLHTRRVLSVLGRIAIASILAGVAALGTSSLVGHVLPVTAALAVALTQLMAATVVGALLLVAGLYAFRVPEASILGLRAAIIARRIVGRSD
ncbi:murein biosynthesis integral membrane protein MurJ [Pseudonocardia xinjiangensis]|uniref:murein biosynthesis integral membrane protein MurJ n=1 Tax=Pseudonocardia xinjiangensis TaxID=75289 RepID=UPI003D8DE04C